MKQSIYIFFILLFSSCFFPKKAVESLKFDIPSDLQAFLKSFEYATVTHNKKDILKLMDDDYLKGQHDEMLNGRTDQFLNELFCGYTLIDKKFIYPGFEKITSLKLTNVENNTDSYTVYYSVTAGDILFTADWTVTVKKINSGIKYGIYGAVG